MKIAVVRPSMFGTPASDHMMPLLFSILKGLTPPEFELFFYDERLRPLPEKWSESVIAITIETFTAKRSYALADACRSVGKTVIVGGHHVSMLPDEAAQHADVVMLGDAEQTWPQVLLDLQSGNLNKVYACDTWGSLSGIRYDYSIFRKGDYKLIALAQFGRGCKYRCDFCSIHAFYGNSVRYRPIDELIADIKSLTQKYIFFVDDNIFADEETSRKLFDAMRPLKKKWICQISMDVASKPDLLREMKESGCILVIMGFESLNRENLIAIGKSANLALAYEDVIGNIYAAGLMIYGTFIVGYDHDTATSADALCDFALKHKFAVANFNPLMPMPGTPLYQRLKDEGRLAFDEWWLNDDYCYGDAMLVPKNMSMTELRESCKNARFRFNSFRNILRRAGRPGVNSKSLSNFIPYLAASIVSRKEIYSKQGRKLGAVR
ncbi:MAG: B12-binding domain-containing radical SAM protein [Clostridiales Family XIII bacterium]|jgi:radical SAM superfamily enzyme YgiQ (UPF0313 family)|nr:B12-binding domain-containing radical SAM protein [Clostridiales Family XIII bacterium]